MIATATWNGTVSVWDRKSFSLLYQGKHPGDKNVRILSLASDNCVITGGRSLAMFENIGEGWGLAKHVEERVTDIAIDGRLAVVGTGDELKQFNIQTHTYVDDIPQLPVRVAKLAFSYPLVFAVGDHMWGGVKIWDITTGLQVGETLLGVLRFQHIHINKHVLIVSWDDINDNQSTDEDEKTSSVFIYDLQQVKEGPVSDSRCLKKQIEIPGGDIAAISSNTTSLFVCMGKGNKVVVMDFWNVL